MQKLSIFLAFGHKQLLLITPNHIIRDLLASCVLSLIDYCPSRLLYVWSWPHCGFF